MDGERDNDVDSENDCIRMAIECTLKGKRKKKRVLVYDTPFEEYIVAFQGKNIKCLLMVSNYQELVH